MAIKKSDLYAKLWAGCDVLRGGMDASQYKDYVLSLLFIKYVSDKYAGQPYGAIKVPAGSGFADMVALKGKTVSLGSVWGDPSKSWTKVCHAIRAFAGQLAANLGNASALEQVIAKMCKIFTKTCNRNKRSKPGTMELLNDISLLNFRLS